MQCDLYAELPPCVAAGHRGLEDSICHVGIRQVSSPKTIRLHLLVSPRPPRNPTVASPGSGVWNVCTAFLSRIADQRACHLPQKECCLLILSHSGNLHSTAACQNTVQVNMSFDCPLIAAKDSLNLIHK